MRRSIQAFVEYIEVFARYKQNDNLHAVGGIFEAHPQINNVERAMLGTSGMTLWHVMGL